MLDERPRMEKTDTEKKQFEDTSFLEETVRTEVKKQFKSILSSCLTALDEEYRRDANIAFEDRKSAVQSLTFNKLQLKMKYRLGRKKALTEDELKSTGLINVRGYYTNLGLILSDQCPFVTKFYRGTENCQEISGPVFEQIKSIESLNYSIDPNIIGVPDYSAEAVREILLNMVIHRDYSISAPNIVKVTGDRIEYISVGGLSEDTSLEDIRMGLSVCRNPKLAKIFHTLKYTGLHGAGIDQIIAGASTGERANNKPSISWMCSDHAFKEILPVKKMHSTEYQQIAKENEISRVHEVAAGYSWNIPKYNLYISDYETNYSTSTRKDAAISTDADANRQNFILRMMRYGNGITRNDVQRELEVSQTTAGKLLRNLVDQGLVVQKGKGRNVFYIKAEDEKKV